MEAYKRKGMSAWAWLVIALMGVFILAYASCAEAGQVSAISKERIAYVCRIIDKLETRIPKLIIKAIAWAESKMRQFNPDGSTYIGKTGDIGVMQISLGTIKKYYPWVDIKRLRTDTKYNIEIGVRILEDKLEFFENRKLCSDWTEFKRRYNLWGHTDLEMAIRYYNSIHNERKYLDRVNEFMEIRPWEKYLE